MVILVGLLASLLGLASSVPVGAVPAPTPIGVDLDCNDAEIELREYAVLAAAVARRIDVIQGVVVVNSNEIAAVEAALAPVVGPAVEQPASLEGSGEIVEAVTAALSEAEGIAEEAQDTLDAQLAIPQAQWFSCGEILDNVDANLQALSAMFRAARGDLDASNDIVHATRERADRDGVTGPASERTPTRGEVEAPSRPGAKPGSTIVEPVKPVPVEELPTKPGGGGGGGLLMVDNYCMADDVNLRTGIRSHGGFPTEPATITQPSDGAFIALDGNIATYAGQVESWENAEGDNIRVVGHLFDDRAAPVDIMSMFPVVYVRSGPFDLDVLSPDPLCYQDVIGDGTTNPMMGYVDTRELAEIPPPAIASSENLTYSPLGEIDARSAITVGVEMRDGGSLAASPIQTDQHTVFVGDAPYEVGEEVPADLGVRIDASLLQVAEDWLDDEITSLGASLDAQLTALNRVQHASVSNVDVNISVSTPVAGDNDETVLNLSASVGNIFIRLRKNGGNNNECGDVNVGPINASVSIRLDHSNDGQSFVPVVLGTPMIDLGDLDVQQTNGWLGCAEEMGDGLDDVNGVFQSFFGFGAGSGSAGCGVGGWILVGLAVVIGVFTGGLGFLAAGAIGAGGCLSAPVAPGGPSLGTAIWQSLSGNLHFTIDLGQTDISPQVDAVVAQIAAFSIGDSLANTDMSMTIVDSCDPYGCDGGQIAITPAGVEVLADLNLQLRAPAGGGGVASTHTFNHPDVLPSWLSGAYGDGLSVADVLAADTPLGGGASDLGAVVGYDSLNAALAQLTADGVLDTTHGAYDECLDDGSTIDNSVTTSGGLPLTFNVRTTVPPIVVGLPYTNSVSQLELPTSIGLRNIAVDLYTAANELLVSVYVDINGGLGFDYSVLDGELVPVIDVDVETMRVVYRDTLSSHGLLDVFILPPVEEALADEVTNILVGLTEGECGLKPIEVDAGVSSLVDGSGNQLIDVDVNIWMQAFSSGIAIYADVLAPLDVNVAVLSFSDSNATMGVRADPNLSPANSFEYRWRVRTQIAYPSGGTTGAWTSWTVGDRNRTFTIPLPAPLPDFNQDVTGMIDVEVRDNFGRVASGTASRFITVWCEEDDWGGDCIL